MPGRSAHETPPRPLSPLFDEDEMRQMPETPAPQRARVTNLNKQVERLVKDRHNLTRKAQAEQASLQETINQQQERLSAQDKAFKELQATLKVREKELERCKVEGDGMRDELNMIAVLHQQKALLALAEEQLHVVELEQRLVKAEQARVMRDHKLAMFQAREADLLAELAEKVGTIDGLEESLAAANASIEQSTASSEAISTSLSSASTEKAKLESRIASLESKLAKSQSRETDLQAELESVMNDDKSKDGLADKERKELQKELRSVKADLKRKEDASTDLQEEVDATVEGYKERERQLKARLKAAQGDGARSRQDEAVSPIKKVTSAKTADVGTVDTASPKKAKKPIKTAAPPAESDSDAVPSPKRTAKTSASEKRPLAESSETNKATTKVKVPSTVASKVKEKAKAEKRKAPSVSCEDEDDDVAETRKAAPAAKKLKEKKAPAAPTAAAVAPPAPAPAVEVEKKKKRKFGLKAAPAFQWDPIEGSGSGVIPSTLSPMRIGTGALNIPRAGFPSGPSSRMLSKLS